MEFHEKLKELRKAKGLTQEELADLLFVSRTAVSKWESGKGYPNLDSLKELSAFFSVSIDQLIRPESAILLAESEKKASLHAYAVFLCCAVDMLVGLLLFLPIFGANSVSIFAWTESPLWVRIVFLTVIGITVLNGVCGLILLHFDQPLWHRHRVYTGIALSIIGSMVFIASRQPYAAMLYFSLLLVKSCVLFRKR